MIKKRAKIILTIIILLMALNTSTTFAAIDNENERVVYLTFDDGPSMHNTERVLDILKANNVKATFFLVGSNVENYSNIVKRMKDYDMAIFPHCNNHKYTELYSSKEYYFNDLLECNSSIKKATGVDKRVAFVRMPGGSDNKIANENILCEIKEDLLANNYCYVDWNVDIGDATSVKASKETLIDNVNKYAGTYKVEVVLMHDLDSKDSTIEALERIIEEYKVMGYKFKTFNEITIDELEYLKSIGVINRK